MQSEKRSKHLRPTRLTLLLMLAFAPCAWAQEAAAPDQPALPDVMVNATKQGSTSFTTPASVSVVSGDAIDNQNLDSLTDVAQRMPNVYLTNFTNSNPTITIRGLGFSDDESDSASVGLTMDGVPVASAMLGALFDMEQIEVLRGPQSTLYGQSSMGGIIAMKSRDPGFTSGGTAQLEYGTGNRKRGTLATDLPFNEDTALRLSVAAEDGDGYVRNSSLGRSDTSGWQSRMARLKFLHRDQAGGEWRLTLQHIERHGGNDFFAPANLASQHQSNANEAGTNNTEFTLLAGEYHRHFGGGTRLAVTLGASDSRWNYWMPTSIFGGASGFDSSTRQLSAEARLSGETAPQGGFDWMVGTYASHLKKKAPYLFEMTGVYSSSTSAAIEGDTAALFGELGWRVAPAWRVAAALRYEHDNRAMDWSSTQAMGGFSVSDTAHASMSDNVLLPRLTLEYRPDERHFGWVTLARGYKASGFNQYATTASTATTPYAPEYGNYAELGYRLRDAQRAWEVGATAFYTRLHNQQVAVTDSGGQTSVSNAGRSHNLGLELNGTLRPGHGVEINTFAGYVRAVYDDYVNGGVDYAGQQFANTPRHSYGVALNWRPAPAWDAGVSVRRFGSSNLYPTTSVVNGAYTLVDANLSYRFDRWTLGLYGKNLTDATYYTRAVDANTLVAAQPRTIGIRASVDF